jgi:hypothetical protein
MSPLRCGFKGRRPHGHEVTKLLTLRRTIFRLWGSPTMKDNPLFGTWKLKSLETRALDGSVSYPWGKQILGYVIFSPEGYFCVAIMSANRRRFSSQDMKGGSLEERANAADSYISYSGPCEIEKDKFRVKVEVSLFPNWIGGFQERYYKIEGKTLSVSTAPTLVDGKEQIGCLIFEHA